MGRRGCDATAGLKASEPSGAAKETTPAAVQKAEEAPPAGKETATEGAGKAAEQAAAPVQGTYFKVSDYIL